MWRPGALAGIFRRALPERRLSPAWAPASAIIFLPCLLAAQSPEAANPAAAPVVRAIDIRRSDIFDPGEARGWLQRAANGLHYMTRDAIVRRELLFRAGEPYDSARVFESARNLRALGVFRDVSVDTVTSDSG